MANEPQDYSGMFNEDIDAKESVDDGNAQGQRSVPGMNYIDAVHPDNPDHVLAHGISDHVADLAIAIEHMLLTDSARAILTWLKLANHIGPRGWCTVDTIFGGKLWSGFHSSATFRLAGASGNTLDCYCADPINDPIDPRSAVTINGASYNVEERIFENVVESGCFVMPFCLVRFHGSVIDNRIQGRVIKPDFSSLGATVDPGDTFTVEIDQSASNAMVALDPEIPVTVEFIGEYQEPEQWPELDDQYATPFVEVIRVYTSADWGVEKKIELTDAGLASCRCAPPHRDKSRVHGTFKAEVSDDGGVTYSDITTALESASGIPGIPWPRYVVSGKMRDDVATHLYLGPITGDATDYTAGITHVRVRHEYPVTPFKTAFTAGARHRDAMCQHSQRDHMNWVGTNSTIVAKDINADGEHWFCLQHRVIPSANAEKYTWDDYQRGAPACGGCPLFTPKRIQVVNEHVIAGITSGQNIVLKQSAPGVNEQMDWTWMRIKYAGFIWLLSDPIWFTSNLDAAFVRRSNPQSGSYVMVDENDATDMNGFGDEHIKWISGAFWNVLADPATLDFESNRFPAEVFGILPRRIPSALMALTQLSEARDGSNDPNYQIYSERLGRKPAPAYRDAYRLNSDLALSARDVAGLEGENRLQRVREFRKFQSGIVKAQVGRQGDTRKDYITVYATARTVEGVANVKAVVQLRPRGVSNYGKKRIGGWGINGEVWRFEDLGGGLFAIHCAPGQWIATEIVAATGGSVTVDHHFFAGSNVVQMLPPHFAPDGAYGNNANAVLVGGGHHKAVRGDTIEFFDHVTLRGKQFIIEDALACAGDLFTGEHNDMLEVRFSALGTFATFEEHYADGASPTIEPTAYEAQFIETLGTWASVGVEAIEPTPNEQRPYSYAGDPLDTPKLHLDLVTRFDEAQFGNITNIYNGGVDLGFRTVIVTEAAHGRAEGEVIYLRNTPTGLSDFNHTIYQVFSPTILVSNRINLSPAGEGTIGEWIAAGANSMVQVGSGRMYPSFPVFGWIYSRIPSVLVANANKIRITYKVNGAEQAPKEVTILTPRVTLDHAASEIMCELENRLTGETEVMTYAGVSANSFDLFTGQSYLTFKYNPAMREVYFHPLVTGDAVKIRYRTAEPLDLDGLGEPGVFWRQFQNVPERGYLKHCDLLRVRESNGFLDAQTPETMARKGFYISDGAAAIDLSEVGHSPAGEATWTVLAPEHYEFMQCMNQLLILQSGWNLLPDLMNLYEQGLFAERIAPMSAEVMQVLKEAMGCLDTIVFGLTISEIGSVGLGAFFQYGFQDITPGTGTSTVTGTPDTRGIYDDYLPGGNQAVAGSLLRIPGHERNFSKHPQAVDAGEFYFSNFTPAVDDPVFAIGCEDTNHARLSMAIFEIGIPDCIKRLPAGTVIVDAAIEVYLPPDCTIALNEFVAYFKWSQIANSSEGGLVLTDNSYDDDFGSITDETAMPGGFGLIGFDPSIGDEGAWVPLGSFKDVGGGSLEVGHWRVIKAKGLIEKLMSLKDSPYSKLAIYPTPEGLESIAETAALSTPGYEQVGILEQIIDGYQTLTSGGKNEQEDYRVAGAARYLKMDSPMLYGAGYVKFKVADEQLQDLRLQPGGAFPDMRPV